MYSKSVNTLGNNLERIDGLIKEEEKPIDNIKNTTSGHFFPTTLYEGMFSYCFIKLFDSFSSSLNVSLILGDSI